MRYLVIQKENSAPEVAIWTKSQYRDSKNRECSYRDYLRNNNIAFEDAVSIGSVYYNPSSGQSKVQFLPWDGPKHHDDAGIVSQAVRSFAKANPELRDEIQSDWNEYQAWEKRRQELLGR